MQVSANELNAIKIIALSQANLVKLGEFDGRQSVVDHLKKAKKVWWTTIRNRYNLSSTKGSRRLAIELDGDRAGELRYKAANADDRANPDRRVVQALSPAAQGPNGSNGSNGASQAGNGQSAQAAAADVVCALQKALDAAGIPVQVSVKADGAYSAPVGTQH